GFLSENADFAQAVIDVGLTWVGPPPAAIRSLGSKSAAKALALQHGVPVLPGYFGADQSDATFLTEAERIGTPLMVKAVAGGGGRGMRLVQRLTDLPVALQSARSEALAGFGNGDLLIERAVLRPRHVEVQVFADAQGHCVHLGERDCSVQRRHQKIIEEAPSPAVSPALREELGRCAVALAQAAGYVGAGTVEFLLEEAESGEASASARFFLMEMNTRLQVEHPVTEMLTGLDLVAWQIRVARGEPLPLTQEQITFNGHAIEVRLCAEDEHFTPHTGRVQAFQPPPLSPGLRFDHALEAGSKITLHYDAMLGKLIAHAPTRTEAIQHLAHALDATTVLGLPTNRAFLAACLRHPVFCAGDARIPFLAEHGDALREQLQPMPDAVLAGVLAATYHGLMPSKDLPCPFARPLRWQHAGHTLELAVHERGQGGLSVTLVERIVQARLAQGHVTIDGVVWRANAVPLSGGQGAGHWQVQVGAHTLSLQDLSHTPREREGGASAARELRAPFNGKLIAVHAQAGADVQKGAPLFVIESMKLEHQIAAPRDGRVDAVPVSTGQQVAPGQVLVTFSA
ncbi:MAG: carbamoyl-phosphate synthase large subunit, partial [Comamonadaceae bacterium]|nr:carbamoyl-phosphate synthase large subunit [Comamonadaceae bacterium]